MALKIWLGDKLVDEQDAKVSVFDHGLLYGDGVFEGIRVYNSKVFELDAHIERLYNSAKGIRLTYSDEQKAADRGGAKDGRGQQGIERLYPADCYARGRVAGAESVYVRNANGDHHRGQYPVVS